MQTKTRPSMRSLDGRLKTAFRTSGFYFQLVARTDAALLYSKARTLDGPALAYEVFEVKWQRPKERHLPDGRVIAHEAQERFPCDEDFGRWAWTYRTEVSAREKLNGIENRHRPGGQIQARPKVAV